jgi:probable F420-dependent oxidoreductase
VKIDGSLLVDNPEEAGPAAAALESMGYDGGFTFEGRHDPFIPLVIAAQQTQRLELATAVAIAFARNPMLLANIGYDLQLLSKGRFQLGLGSQIRPHIEKRFSSTWSRPAARMREMVLAIRAIWANWQEGEALSFQGEFYTHTLMTPIFSPGPNPYGLPKVFIAGIGPKMTEVAGEVGDGFFVHPFHTPEFISELTLPALTRGLEKAGRRREDFEISCQLIVACAEDEEGLETAKNGARMQIGFYASTPAYRPVLDGLGLGKLQEELNALSKQGDWLKMAGRIDDELLEQIAVVGSPDEVADEIRKRCDGFADRVSPVAAFGGESVDWAKIVAKLKEDQ